MSGIENIIFDLGGVVLDIDYMLTLGAFNELGINIENQSDLTGSNEIFNLFDCGLISPEEFRLKICRSFHKSISNEVFDRAWNRLLLDWDINRLNYIEALRRKYKIFLLSNTNAIHFFHYNNSLVKKTGKELKSYFDKTYLSFEQGMRKPHPEIFLKVINENKLNPQKTLFIDDTLEHVRTAQKIGIHTIHLEGGNRANPLQYLLNEFLNPKEEGN